MTSSQSSYSHCCITRVSERYKDFTKAWGLCLSWDRTSQKTAYLFQTLSQARFPGSPLQAYFQTSYFQHCWHQNLQGHKQELINLKLLAMKFKTQISISHSKTALPQLRSNSTHHCQKCMLNKQQEGTSVVKIMYMSYNYTTDNISLEIYCLAFLSFLICYKIQYFIKPKRTSLSCCLLQHQARLVSWTACKEHPHCILSIPHTPLVPTDKARNSPQPGECTAQKHTSKAHPNPAPHRLDCKLKAAKPFCSWLIT